jgi:hypothetical protein
MAAVRRVVTVPSLREIVLRHDGTSTGAQARKTEDFRPQ